MSAQVAALFRSSHSRAKRAERVSRQAITVAAGDGVGPEILQAVLMLLEAAGAQVEPEFVEIGTQAYAQGFGSGISDAAWDSIRRTQVLLKGPVSTPRGRAYKNINVTLRKALGLFANVRPCLSYHPFVPTRHPALNVVVIRENEEDLYGGTEYRQTTDVVQGLKLVSRPGCEKIIRYAFEYAQIHGRRKISAFTKDKVMEFTDGFFHELFREIAKAYPDMICEHQSLDLGTARLSEEPERFDLIVIPNLYGDILSDLVTQITTGSVALSGATNFGNDCAMFETIHGSAEDLAGQDLANPSGLLLAAIMLLVHIDQQDIAQTLHNAWLSTLEAGLHTADIYREGLSQQKLGTQAFAQAVLERLGQTPQVLKPVVYQHAPNKAHNFAFDYTPPEIDKAWVGVDVFLDWREENALRLGQEMSALNTSRLRLEIITNLGVTVWPEAFPETRLSDHWHCRFTTAEGDQIQAQDVLTLLQKVQAAGFDWIKTENLYRIDGVLAYSG